MTAREFYGPAFDQLRLAEKQVLGEVRQGQKTWRDQGRSSPVLYTSSRIKSPDSMRRKLLLRGCLPTRQAALTQVRDAVGVRVICAFQNDVYLVAQWLEERPAFVVLETKDYISYPKENGYRSYHLILGIREGPGKGTTVEVQLRTIATDFWASLEHQLKYKREVPPRRAHPGGTAPVRRRDCLGGPVHGDHPGTAGGELLRDGLSGDAAAANKSPAPRTPHPAEADPGESGRLRWPPECQGWSSR